MGNLVEATNRSHVVKPKVGDRVQFSFTSVITGPHPHESIDVAVSNHYYEEAGYKAYKGTVVKISTHTWLGLIERTRPLYFIELDMFPGIILKSDVVKKIIR